MNPLFNIYLHLRYLTSVQAITEHTGKRLNGLHVTSLVDSSERASIEAAKKDLESE
jgi:hypothetical protein